MVKHIKSVWGTKAEKDLRVIYYFYAGENENYAHRIIDDIVKNAESIVFAEQYQEDEILPKVLCKTLENRV